MLRTQKVCNFTDDFIIFLFMKFSMRRHSDWKYLDVLFLCGFFSGNPSDRVKIKIFFFLKKKPGNTCRAQFYPKSLEIQPPLWIRAQFMWSNEIINLIIFFWGIVTGKTPA